MHRRTFLGLTVGTASVLAGALLIPIRAPAAWLKAAFESTTLDEAMKALFGTAQIKHSNAVVVDAPELATSATHVPVTVSTSLENPESIAIFSEKNPNPLIASFTLTPEVSSGISVRIKVGGKTNVVGVVRADGALYQNQTYVRATAGACA
ncbi:MAG: thiosulfate oxidation carrier protein SoxY [Pseudomonadota bacterium]|nr:thiosulfate oxidation carrier protein SoxY [Pseudomonadota bacterium]